MKRINDNKEIVTLKNKIFRQVIHTSKYLKVVLMRLNPGEETGEETHKSTDQLFRFGSGRGIGILDGNEYRVENGDTIVIPAGASYNVINTDPSEGFMMYTIFAPTNHEDGIINSIKREAKLNSLVFEGKRTG